MIYLSQMFTKIIQIIQGWQACNKNDCLGQPTNQRGLLLKIFYDIEPVIRQVSAYVSVLLIYQGFQCESNTPCFRMPPLSWIGRLNNTYIYM